MDIQCDIKIKYSTVLGKLFGWILKGPIEGHSFEVVYELKATDVQNDSQFWLNFVPRLEEIGNSLGQITSEKREKIKFVNGKYRFSEKYNGFSGKYKLLLFFETNIPLKLFDINKITHRTVYEVPEDMTIMFGSPYYSESLTIHPFTDVILLLFAFLSGLGAIFEILGYFKSTS